MAVVLDFTTGAAALASVIEAEFAEMPGMRLTEAQVRRLWHLSRSDCESVLQLLVEAGRLVRDPGGQYARAGTALKG